MSVGYWLASFRVYDARTAVAQAAVLINALEPRTPGSGRPRVAGARACAGFRAPPEHASGRVRRCTRRSRLGVGPPRDRGQLSAHAGPASGNGLAGGGRSGTAVRPRRSGDSRSSFSSITLTRASHRRPCRAALQGWGERPGSSLTSSGALVRPGSGWSPPASDSSSGSATTWGCGSSRPRDCRCPTSSIDLLRTAGPS